jgi:hypothetical protein
VQEREREREINLSLSLSTFSPSEQSKKGRRESDAFIVTKQKT